MLKTFILNIVSVILIIIAVDYSIDKFGLVKRIPTGWGWVGSPSRLQQPASADIEVNQLGLRGRKIEYSAEDFVVLLVGDSMVESAATKLEEMPEHALELSLTSKFNRPIKVFSIASSGWGQDQQLLALRKYFSNFRADLVLLYSVPSNDIWENTFPDRSITSTAGHLKPTFLLVENQLRGPFFQEPIYYGGHAITQLAFDFYHTIIKRDGVTYNQILLDNWYKVIPSHDREVEIKCHDNALVNQSDVSSMASQLDNTKAYNIATNEDIEHSRSHFAIQLNKYSLLDIYERQITKILIKSIQSLSNENHAEFKIFFADTKEMYNTKQIDFMCVSTPEKKNYLIGKSKESALRDMVDQNDLIVFKIPGGEEGFVSKQDRHLSAIGIERAMNMLANSLQVALPQFSAPKP